MSFDKWFNEVGLEGRRYEVIAKQLQSCAGEAEFFASIRGWLECAWENGQAYECEQCVDICLSCMDKFGGLDEASAVAICSELSKRHGL